MSRNITHRKSDLIGPHPTVI